LKKQKLDVTKYETISRIAFFLMKIGDNAIRFNVLMCK